MNTDSIESRVDMWLDAILKMRQGIQMQYRDICPYDKDTWKDWNYDPENPPDFDVDMIWREKPTQNNLFADEKFEEYLNVLRKIRAGVRMEYNAAYWGNDEYIEWDEDNLPGFDTSHTWRECQQKSIEDVKIRQIMIVPNFSLDCKGQASISFIVKIDDGEPEIIHHVKPGNPFYIAI